MNLKMLSKAVVSLVLFAGLTACMDIISNYNDQSYSEAKNPAFDLAMEHERWVRDEFATYKSRRGFKAFAIAVQNDYVLATGFGDDKVTMEWAEREAMRMCHHFSQGAGVCAIVDKAESKGGHGLSQQQIDSAPKELIAHRDIRHYQNYLKAKAPKAFAVAACSGQAFWVAKAKSKEQAAHEALYKCEDGRHASDPCCTVLEAE